MTLVQELAVQYNNHSTIAMKTNKGYEKLIGEITGFDFSDHWSFWENNYPAVMITDTAFLRNPHYHKSSDKYTTLDFRAMAEVVKGLVYGISKL